MTLFFGISVFHGLNIILHSPLANLHHRHSSGFAKILPVIIFNFEHLNNVALYHFLLWTYPLLEDLHISIIIKTVSSISEMESVALKICEQQLFQFGWIDVTEGQFVVMAVMLVTAAEGFFDVNIWNSPVIIFILNTVIMIIIVVIVIVKQTSS